MDFARVLGAGEVLRVGGAQLHGDHLTTGLVSQEFDGAPQLLVVGGGRVPLDVDLEPLVVPGDEVPVLDLPCGPSSSSDQMEYFQVCLRYCSRSWRSIPSAFRYNSRRSSCVSCSDNGMLLAAGRARASALRATGSPVCTGCMCSTGFPTEEAGSEVDSRSTSSSNSLARKALCFRSTQLGSTEGIVLAISDSWSSASSFTAAGSR